MYQTLACFWKYCKYSITISGWLVLEAGRDRIEDNAAIYGTGSVHDWKNAAHAIASKQAPQNP